MSHSKTLLVEKIVDSTIDKVWDAWADPEKLAQWWRTKGTERTVITEYDFRPGGVWRQKAIMDGGFDLGESNPGVSFKEIVPLEKIVAVPNQITEDAVVITPDLEETVVTFESLGENKTRVAITLVRSNEDDWQPNKLHGSVYDEIFDNLGKFVASNKD